MCQGLEESIKRSNPSKMTELVLFVQREMGKKVHVLNHKTNRDILPKNVAAAGTTTLAKMAG